MNKSDLIQVVSERAKITPQAADKAVSTIFDEMTNELAGGGRIEIRGFGSFSVVEYEAYTGRNPKTGEKIAVAPKKSPFFKVGKELKERILGLE